MTSVIWSLSLCFVNNNPAKCTVQRPMSDCTFSCSACLDVDRDSVFIDYKKRRVTRLSPGEVQQEEDPKTKRSPMDIFNSLTRRKSKSDKQLDKTPPPSSAAPRSNGDVYGFEANGYEPLRSSVSMFSVPYQSQESHCPAWTAPNGPNVRADPLTNGHHGTHGEDVGWTSTLDFSALCIIASFLHPAMLSSVHAL